MLADLHMHLAPDGERLGDAALSLARLRRYVEQAHARGVAEIAITEHVYRFAEAAGLHPGPFWAESARDDLVAYRSLLTAAAAEDLPVLAGLELDWVAGQDDALAALADEPGWDVVLGSVHWHGPHAYDHPDYSIWDAHPVEEVYRRYFDDLGHAAASGHYDVMAHPDLAKVFGHRLPFVELLPLYERAADAFAAGGVCVEVSTAGLRKPAAELYPAHAFLVCCAERGVPATLGSDAHVAGDVGRDFDLAVTALHDAGYRTATTFRRREPRQVPLG